jgi:hypothetical protein
VDTLRYPADKQPEEITEKNYTLPKGTRGLSVTVEDDKESVILSIGDRSISMSISGARDLALALRQSANRVYKSTE